MVGSSDTGVNIIKLGYMNGSFISECRAIMETRSELAFVANPC